MRNMKELTKIANKLDSLGLTKEADALDAYIRKTAGVFGFAPGYKDYSPPGMVPELMSKWLDYMTLDGGFLGAFGQTLPTNQLKNVRKAEMEIRSILKVVKDMSTTQDNRNKLITWYGNNIEACTTPTIPDSCHNNITNDLLELASDIKSMSSHPRNNIAEIYDPETRERVGKLSDLYKPIIAEIRATAGEWKRSFGADDVVEESPETSPVTAPRVSAPIAEATVPGGAAAMTKTKTYPKKPSSPMTWDKYIANVGPSGSDVKKAWEELSLADKSATRRDSSFPSFKSWYIERKGGEWGGMDKNTSQTIAAINNEIERSRIWGTVENKPTTTTGAFPN